jgi:D-3-phosphoglycerate dehydrogenase
MHVLISEAAQFSPEALARLQRVGTVAAGDLSRAALLSAVPPADILWVRLRHRIDREVMESAPNLRIIVTNTTGLDHIDLAEAQRRQIRVLSLRGETDFLRTVRATAELTIALLLALLRQLPRAAAHVRDGGWDRYPFKGHELYGKTAGVVGYGRLGRIVAGMLVAFGMHVIAATKADDLCEPEPGVALLPLDVLLSEADVITLHVNLADSTRGMLGQREFGRMKRGAWFVNTARGELVDEAALVRSLDSGQVAGAALDVLSDTYGPDDWSSPLRRYASTHDNLLITPHIGGYTFESLEKTELFLVDRLLDALAAVNAFAAGPADVDPRARRSRPVIRLSAEGGRSRR